MLSRDLEEYYIGAVHPWLAVRVGGYEGFNISNNIRMRSYRSYSGTPQQLSERVFDWVEE